MNEACLPARMGRSELRARACPSNNDITGAEAGGVSLLFPKAHLDHRAGTFEEQVVPLIGTPMICLENVPQVAARKEYKDDQWISPLDKVKSILADEGYVVEHRIMNALDVGAAVSRDRLFCQALTTAEELRQHRHSCVAVKQEAKPGRGRYCQNCGKGP